MSRADVDFWSGGLLVVFVGLFFDGRLEVMIHDWGFEERVGKIVKR